MTHSSVKRCKDEIDALEFAEWKVTYRIEPWGDDWQQAATIARETHNQLQLLIGATVGSQHTPNFTQNADYVPYAKKTKSKRRRMTAEESEAAARAMYG